MYGTVLYTIRGPYFFFTPSKITFEMKQDVLTRIEVVILIFIYLHEMQRKFTYFSSKIFPYHAQS